jgi:1,4-alpha-glucan branching enzyme
MVRDLNRVYQSQPALWEQDFEHDGFEWIDADDSDQSVASFIRRRAGGGVDGAVVCVANLTPVPRLHYRVGLPAPGVWIELLNTDALEWGGGGLGNLGAFHADDVPWHGRRWSASLTLPPLSVLWLAAE